MSPLRIAVGGAGTAGAAAALFLARAGHQVTLFEKVADPLPVGAGILLQPTGMAVLAALGLLEETLALGAKVTRLIGHNHRGWKVMDMRYDDWRRDAFGLGIHRGALFGVLQAALARSTVARRYGVDAAGEDLSGFDLVVAADGMRSPLRARSGLPAKVTPYPWGAVWLICEDPGERHAGVLSQHYRAAREMLGVLPTGRLARDGAPLVNLFWSLPVADHARWRERGLAAFRDDALALWPGAAPLLDTVRDVAQVRFADYCDVVMPRWHTDRMVVIGDAAHATSPQLGQGANLALIDAWVLSRALSRHADVPAALAAYSAARRAHLRYYQWASRMLTPVFQSHQRLAPALRDLTLGWAGRLPGFRGQAGATLAGTKAGLLWGALPLPGSEKPDAL